MNTKNLVQYATAVSMALALSTAFSMALPVLAAAFWVAFAASSAFFSEQEVTANAPKAATASRVLKERFMFLRGKEVVK